MRAATGESDIPRTIIPLNPKFWKSAVRDVIAATMRTKNEIPVNIIAPIHQPLHIPSRNMLNDGEEIAGEIAANAIMNPERRSQQYINGSGRPIIKERTHAPKNSNSG